jgi:hypothetical protein
MEPLKAIRYMGYSLRTDLRGGWRYTAWLQWNSTAPLIPAHPSNGTNHFVEELYFYNTTVVGGNGEKDFNGLDADEVSGSNPEIVKWLWSELITMVVG